MRGVLFCWETGKVFPRFLICSENGYNANIYRAGKESCTMTGRLSGEWTEGTFTGGWSWGTGAKPQGSSVQPPSNPSASSKVLGTQKHEAKGGPFLEWPSHLPRAQQLPRDFYGLKGNLPVIPSAATRLKPPQHNKSFKEQSAFILGERSVSRHFQFCISSLPFLSSSRSKRQDGQALSKKNLAA